MSWPSTLRHAGAALLAALVHAGAAAQAFPTQPLRIIVPAPPGSGPDVHARKIGDTLARSLGQPVLIENRPGANGIIGAELAAKAQPDGHTLLLTNNAQMAINPAVFRKLPYQPLRDFAPVTGLLGNVPLLLVNAQLPVRTVAELIDYAKARPGKLSYGSQGIVSVPYLAMEQFAQQHGLQMAHIPYKGSNEVVNELIGGRIELALESQTLALPHVQAGRLRALAVVGGQARRPALPDVPTFAELGLPAVQAFNWIGFVVPAGTPSDVIARLQREIAAAAQAPEFRDWAAGLGADLLIDTPAAFGRFIEAEIERWDKVAKRVGARAD